jgi:hypothetical protein
MGKLSQAGGRECKRGEGKEEECSSGDAYMIAHHKRSSTEPSLDTVGGGEGCCSCHGRFNWHCVRSRH